VAIAISCIPQNLMEEQSRIGGIVNQENFHEVFLLTRRSLPRELPCLLRKT